YDLTPQEKTYFLQLIDPNRQQYFPNHVFRADFELDRGDTDDDEDNDQTNDQSPSDTPNGKDDIVNLDRTSTTLKTPTGLLTLDNMSIMKSDDEEDRQYHDFLGLYKEDLKKLKRSQNQGGNGEIDLSEGKTP